RFAAPTPIVTGKTWIARRAAHDVTAPVRNRSTATVVTIAWSAALSTRNATIPSKGPTAEPTPVFPACAKTLDASEISISVEIGGTANIDASSAKGPWNPSAIRAIQTIRTKIGTATTSAGAPRTAVTPRAKEVRIFGIGLVPTGRATNRSK